VDEMGKEFADLITGGEERQERPPERGKRRIFRKGAGLKFPEGRSVIGKEGAQKARRLPSEGKRRREAISFCQTCFQLLRRIRKILRKTFYMGMRANSAI